MRWFVLFLISSIGFSVARGEVDLVIVVGAGGTEEYAAQFAERAERWQTAGAEASANVIRLGPGGEATEAPEDDSEAPENVAAEVAAADDRGQLLERLRRLSAVESESPLWLVLIGHGTFQQGQAKFNFRGPDATAAEFAEALQGAQRPLVIINSASASGPFVAALSGPDRVVVTATQSGDEVNFARFGDYLSQTIADLSADLDHDDSVSILEAFLAASHQTQEFYRREARLATEHALIDDNGDRRGTSADFFRGIRVVKQAADDAQADGSLASRLHLLPSPADLELTPQQRQRIAEIEAQVHQLRERKSELETEAYYSQLEKWMVEMAKLYEQAPKKSAAPR